MPFEQSPNRLCLLRKQHGLSQKQLAVLVGQDRTLISMYERGRILPSLPAAVSFELLFCRSVAEIFPGLFERVKTELENKLQKRGPALARRSEAV
jgi:transcriptional regulator with XRE-family HTH domain